MPFSLDRIVERFGHLAAIRDVLLARDDLPAPTRQALVVKLSRDARRFRHRRANGWREDRARRITREACEKATITLAADSPEGEVRPLIRHLRESGQLNAGLILRSLLSGNVEMFEEALADLAQVPLARVVGIVHDRRGAGFRALYDKAGLPASTFPAFREALEAMREDGFMFEPGGASRLKRRIIERTLTRCESEAPDEIEPLLTLLRRYAAEAAREEARLFCDELVADGAPQLRLHRSRRHRVTALGRSAVRSLAYRRVSIQACARRPRIRSRGAARLWIALSTSGRWRFSLTRNSSVTARSLLVSAAAIVGDVGAVVLADDGAHRIDVLIDDRHAGSWSRSGVCSSSRHRLSAAGPTSG